MIDCTERHGDQVDRGPIAEPSLALAPPAGQDERFLAELAALLPRAEAPGAGPVRKGVLTSSAKKAKRLCEVSELLACALTAAGSGALSISKETRLALTKAAAELSRQLVPLAAAVAARAVSTGGDVGEQASPMNGSAK